jgi:DivIVA domain-containing protein
VSLDFDDRRNRPQNPPADQELTRPFEALPDSPADKAADAGERSEERAEAPPQPAPDPETAPYATVEQEAVTAAPAPSVWGDRVDVDALRDASFPVVWRGYDVHEVDAYVTAVEQALDAFEERTAPTVAVQRALDRVGEQTAAVLRQAEQAAEETTRASRAKADDRLQRAEREAAELHEAALARVRALDDDVERLWEERQRLIDATKDLSERLRATAADAESRFPPASSPPPLPGELNGDPPADADTDTDTDAPT